MADLPSSAPRRKAWKPKTRTGCRTCKRRKVKCDESKPKCRRCLQAQVICDGYEALPKPWLFVPVNIAQATPSPGSLPLLPLDSGASSTSSGSEAVQPPQSKVCKRCGLSVTGCLCEKQETFNSPTLTKLVRPSGPYRGTGEQFNFKYFVEVTAMVVARSGLSSSFWLRLFPQAAWTIPATRDALLSSAITSRHVYNTLAQDSLPESGLQLSPQGTNYENRAIRSLVSRPPAIEAVLMASLAFWMNSMYLGDWEKSLQHSYHALKLVASVEDPSKHDALILKYTQGLGRSCLGFFRTTRGPCPIHGLQRMDLLACDASCYIPEQSSIEMRLADSLYHLRYVPTALADHRKALNSRRLRHSKHVQVEGLLDMIMREVTILQRRWKDIAWNDCDPEKMRESMTIVPFTSSPFPPLLRELNDLIEKDQDSKVVFAILELRMRVTLPNFSASTGRGDLRILKDTINRMAKMNDVSLARPGP